LNRQGAKDAKAQWMCVTLAPGAGKQINRQGAKDAKAQWM
jgi:hypothetical protein